MRGFKNPALLIFEKFLSPKYEGCLLDVIQLDQRAEHLRVVDPPDWTKAQEREGIIRDSLQADGPMTLRVEAAAKTLGLSMRT